MANFTRRLLVGAAILFGGTLLASTGCDQKETLIDVETPGGDLEVERDKSDGEVAVDVEEE